MVAFHFKLLAEFKINNKKITIKNVINSRTAANHKFSSYHDHSMIFKD